MYACRLYEIANRLQKIETTLQINEAPGSPQNTASRSVSRRSPSPATSEDIMDQDVGVLPEENPIGEINSSLDLIVGRTSNRPEVASDDYGAPDIVSGVL